MAHVPKTNTTGITQSEGLLGQLFQYLQSLGTGSTPPPQTPMTGLPTQQGLDQTVKSFLHAPMTANPGGGIDPTSMSNSYQSGIQLGANPARAGINQAAEQAKLGIMDQNINLRGTNLFNNQSMQQMIQQLMGGVSSNLANIGTYPPALRGQAQGVAASGTGGGMDLLGMFGI